jgi:branched-chain amino acid transport system permease protein
MTTVFSGLATGAIFALVAVGFSVVFTTTGVFNFAHPQFIMLGTFIAYLGEITLKLPIVAVFALCVGSVGAVGLICEKIAIGPLQGSGVHSELITTVGVATVIIGVCEVVWGNQPLQVPFFGSNRILTVLGGRTNADDLSLIVVAVVMILLIHLWSNRTLFGLASLAIAENREAAMLRGINVKRYSAGVMIFTGVFTGIIGPLLAPKTYALTTLGSAIIVGGFVALVIGGFESKIGALIGGLLLGLIQAFVGRYGGEQYQNLAIFAVLLLVLLSRPQGLLGSASERTV